MRRFMLSTLATTLACGLAHADAPAPLPGKIGVPEPAVMIDRGSASARFNQVAAFLADQLTQNRDLKNIHDSRIAVTSFANMMDLKDASKVGLALEERLMNEMQIRGFRVIDYKVMGSLRVRQNGDFAYSRNVEDLKNEFNIHYILTGVIESNLDGFVIHARLVDAKNNVQMSSAQAFVPGRDVAKLSGDYKGDDVPRVIIEKPTPYPAGDEYRMRLMR